MLVALGVWGFTVGGATFTKIELGIGAPLAAAVVWGFFVAPGRPRAVLTGAAPVDGGRARAARGRLPRMGADLRACWSPVRSA
ncbi:MAG: YrdB family protein [Actinomycetota bacterium]